MLNIHTHNVYFFNICLSPGWSLDLTYNATFSDEEPKISLPILYEDIIVNKNKLIGVVDRVEAMFKDKTT